MGLTCYLHLEFWVVSIGTRLVRETECKEILVPAAIYFGEVPEVNNNNENKVLPKYIAYKYYCSLFSHYHYRS